MDDTVRSLHRQLFERINLELSKEDFESLRSIAVGKGLRQGEASKCINAREVLDKLQRKGKIKLGCNYQVLKDIFREMEQNELIQIVTEVEKKMEEAGCEISDEVPQTPDIIRAPLKRQMSPPEGWSAEKRRSSFGEKRSGYSFDSSVKNPSFDRQSSGQSRRSSFASRSSMSSSFEDPVVFDDRCYKPGRGYVLIINNFSQEREASTRDVEGLVDFFDKIGYKISTEEDQTKEQMIDALEMAKLEIQKAAKGKNKDNRYSCFICIVSSHGDKEGVKSHDNQTVSIGELQAPFLGDSLACMAGSPKIFIIQACRGEKKQPGVDRADEEPGELPLDVSDVMRSVTTPRDADVLVAYATTEGFKAWRRTGEGSWFLSEMLDVFKVKRGSDHLLDMLTEVNDRVSHRNTVGTEPAKQMPCQVSTLTKKVFL